MVGQRWHHALAHTADVGLRAAAPDRAALFEEAAAALAEIAADIASPRETERSPIEVTAADPEALAFAWLNELIGLGEVRGEALVRTSVAEVAPSRGGWRLRGNAWFAPFDEATVRPRLLVKAATLHRLSLTDAPDGLTLEAYLDV